MAAVHIEAPCAHRPFDIGESSLVFSGPFAASADGLSGWATYAAEGRVCVYARAARAPRAVGDRARTLMAQGLITLRRTRHSSKPSLFDFHARRTGLPIADAKPVPGDDKLPPDARMLLELLVRLADEVSPCPGNEMLAALIGARDGNRVASCLTRLSRVNFIMVHSVEHHPQRQIEILETGAKTGVL
jgi:hypothetical protein